VVDTGVGIRKETRRLFNRAKNCHVDWKAFYLSIKNFKRKCRKAKRDS